MKNTNTASALDLFARAAFILFIGYHLISFAESSLLSTSSQMIAESRRAVVISIQEQGAMHTKDILNILNYDESGDMVGDFTADEIEKILYPNKK